jgi:hypothetical protein
MIFCVKNAVLPISFTMKKKAFVAVTIISVTNVKTVIINGNQKALIPNR